MDDLLQTALLGTAKHPAPPAGHPVDALTTGLTDLSAERHLLLRAGVRTVHDLAGFVPPRVEAVPAAPLDARPACSRRAAQIISEWIAANQHELLIEAYQRLDRAGQRLRPELLSQAIAGGTGFSVYMIGGGPEAERQTAPALLRFERVSQALLPVLGERGRWLYPLYQGILQSTESSSASETGSASPSPDLEEERWKEAPHRERRWNLERLRQTDPDRARQWLMAGWSTEKAEHRAELLGTLAIGLSAGDEGFLDQALGDRSGEVRSIAAKLLARLPGSALSRNVRELAQGMLAYMPVIVRRKLGAAQAPSVSRAMVGTLTVTLPREFDKGWKRLGIEEKPPAGKGARAFWASQILTLIPPSHWEAHCEAPATVLLEAAEGCEDTLLVLEAWSEAALLFEEQAWIQVLWDWWYRRKPSRQGTPDSQRPWLLQLAKKLDAGALEQRAMTVLEDSNSEYKMPFSDIVEEIRRPWSPGLARKYLEVLRKYIARLKSNSAHYNAALQATFGHAAVALPESCFEEALQGWDLLDEMEDNPTAQRRLSHALDQFLPVVRLRKEFRDQVASTTATGDHP